MSPLDRTPVRAAAFVVALAAVFTVALGVGSRFGSLDAPAAAASGHGHGEMSGADHAAASDVPGGVMVSQDGYTLRLAQAERPAGRDRTVAFVIEGPDGRPVTSYTKEHTKDLHLIAVRRDFGGFQHVHPVLGADGTWTTTLDLTPGAWRIFADFTPAGYDGLTLGSDLTVPGAARATSETPVTRTATVDGYTVTLAGDLVAGEHSMLTLAVSLDGAPVTDLQPYLGAYGHLVTLREGDLAYLHVHPGGEPGDGTTKPGPDVEFGAEVPSAGRYHLYLDFRHGGEVRTAPFTLEAS
jgi:hypothetical protein